MHPKHIPLNIARTLALCSLLSITLNVNAGSLFTLYVLSESISNPETEKSSNKSSNSSDTRLNGDYIITKVRPAPKQEKHLEITLKAENADLNLIITIPETTWTPQKLTVGDKIQAKRQGWGVAFNQINKPEQPFCIIPDDEFRKDLESRPLDKQ